MYTEFFVHLADALLDSIRGDAHQLGYLRIGVASEPVLDDQSLLFCHASTTSMYGSNSSANRLSTQSESSCVIRSLVPSQASLAAQAALASQASLAALAASKAALFFAAFSSVGSSIHRFTASSATCGRLSSGAPA